MKHGRWRRLDDVLFLLARLVHRRHGRQSCLFGINLCNVNYLISFHSTMEPPTELHHHKKILPAKRSFGKHHPTDSPTYDAQVHLTYSSAFGSLAVQIRRRQRPSHRRWCIHDVPSCLSALKSCSASRHQVFCPSGAPSAGIQHAIRRWCRFANVRRRCRIQRNSRRRTAPVFQGLPESTSLILDVDVDVSE